MLEWKLKFLSGNHDQIEVQLADGETIIGTDELTADIVLSDESVKPEHFAVVIENDKFRLDKINEISLLMINGTRVSERQNIYIESFDIVQLDGLTFTIGHLGDELLNVNENVAFEEEIKRDLLDRDKVKKLVIFGFSFVLVIVFIFFIFNSSNSNDTFNSSSSVDKKSSNNDSQIVLVKRKLESMNLKDVKANYNPLLKRVELTGYVSTDLDKKQLIKEMQLSGAKFSSKIKSMESIRQSVKFILSNYGYNNVAVLNAAKIGTVSITGFIDSADNWPRVENMLQTDVPGLLGWSNNLQKLNDYVGYFEQMLDQEKLLDKLVIKKKDKRIEAKGELNKKQQDLFYKVASEFSKKYNDPPKVILIKSSPAVVENVQKLKFDVKAVNFGHVPYVVLTNNIRYTKGTRIPSGYLITKISKLGVGLSKGDQHVTISFRRKDDSSNSR